MKRTPEEWAQEWENMAQGKIVEDQLQMELNSRLDIVTHRCAICEHLRLEQKEPAILREDLFMPLVHPRILPPEKFHQENLLICDECWKMCS